MNSDEVAARWRMSPRVVRELLAAGSLVGRKIGGKWLVLPGDVETYERTRLNVQPLRPRRRRSM